jgi:general nucleoside transport system permease protein
MAATQTIQRHVVPTSPNRRYVFGGVFLLFALLIWGVFARSIAAGTTTSFGMNAGGAQVLVAPLVMQARPLLSVFAIICAVIGAYQLARGFYKATNWMLAVVVGLSILGFLIWAAAGKSLNFAELIATTLLKAVPITLGALSGVLSERAGVVNIAIEGMMLSGAFISTLIGSISHSLWLGLISALILGALMALLHGWLSIKYKVNQIISGTVINIFATGLTSYLSSKFLQRYQELNNPGTFAPWPIPGLSKIPVIGPIFFNQNMFVYAMFFFLIILTVALFSTRWGLRLRAVGEHPRAADTLGINVFRTRYMAVILSGMMAGFGGAYFTLGSVGRFDEVMTAGRGFIGLAAMIFGNWTPFGSFGAGLLFGFADSLASRLAILQMPIPSEFLLMAPYIATMIVLAGVIGRSQAPAADGVAYEKE